MNADLRSNVVKETMFSEQFSVKYRYLFNNNSSLLGTSSKLDSYNFMCIQVVCTINSHNVPVNFHHKKKFVLHFNHSNSCLKRDVGSFRQNKSLVVFDITIQVCFLQKNFLQKSSCEKTARVTYRNANSCSSTAKCYSARTYWRQNVSTPKALGAKTSIPKGWRSALKNAVPQTTRNKL